ncbi:MAG: CRISPR-associated endonuclease Cas1 [Eubacteriales bacterium]|nr:CRISPR-associated endonuclease Cas1 [Eubacteriales bacterium]
MRKLLNTIYVTNEDVYLTLDDENLVCKINGKKIMRIPFDNIESIVCFNYQGCSPALMGKCAEKLIPISFLTPTGKYLAKVYAGTRGNVHLRVAQIDVFREKDIVLASNTVAAKIANNINVIKRSLHDHSDLRENERILSVIDAMKKSAHAALQSTTYEEILGHEGSAAKQYFSIFGEMVTNKRYTFTYRNKRPPLDEINSVLSFLYTVYTNEYAGALETVGLDSYIGFFHKLRSGRTSLACDLVEETRCIVDRFTISMFNLNMLSEKNFYYDESGAVFLNDEGRKKVLTKWQEKKRTEIIHPYLKQKIHFGLVPYVQANLLAKYVRGEIAEYPCYINKL